MRTLDWRYRALIAVGVGLTLAACGGEDPVDPINPNPPVVEPQPDPNASIKISEAASTNADFLDEDSDDSDWIELYNASDETVNLAGWAISDDPEIPAQWVFPEVSLAAGEYLIVWASDKDRTDPQLHSNFKLSSDGELLQLFDADGALVDELQVLGAPAGTSAGRDAAGIPALFAEATPGAANPSQTFAGLVTSSVSFSHSGGESAPSAVELSGAGTNEVIRYTLDATAPTSTSVTYVEPIAIADNTVIRASVFREGFIPSAVASRTFIPGETHSLPVISLITDPLNFFDMEFGIYVLGPEYEENEPNYGANFHEDWERPVHFSFYEPTGELGVSQELGVRIHGGYTRFLSQKSLKFFARGQYGKKKLKYPFFPELAYQEFESVILRNSGNDWMWSMMRDAVMTSLMEGSGLVYQAYRPTVVYLNGEYWGLHNMREKISEHFVASKTGIDTDDINLLENNAWELHGDATEYKALIRFMQQSDLSDPAVYEQVEAAIDVENFATLQMAEIYFNNTDWPGNNVKFYQAADSKWRWIIHDTDFGFALYKDHTADTLSFALATDGKSWPNPPWSTRMLRDMLESPEFTRLFINSFADAMNTRFLPEHVNQRIEQYAAAIESEMPRQRERWMPNRRWASGGFPVRAAESTAWRPYVDQMKVFANERPAVIVDLLTQHFGLAAPVTVAVSHPPSQGQVHLNSLLLESPSWQGKYFPGNAITLRAEPLEGYQFAGWTGGLESAEAEITVNPADVTELIATFVAVD